MRVLLGAGSLWVVCLAVVHIRTHRHECSLQSIQVYVLCLYTTYIRMYLPIHMYCNYSSLCMSSWTRQHAYIRTKSMCTLGAESDGQCEPLDSSWWHSVSTTNRTALEGRSSFTEWRCSASRNTPLQTCQRAHSPNSGRAGPLQLMIQWLREGLASHHIIVLVHPFWLLIIESRL